MRCEKSGVGDSTGPPCIDRGLLEEVGDFTSALKRLKSYDFVDSKNVFIFGISAGGWVGPLVAERERPRGIIVYGTVIRPFSEYLVENHRRNKWLRKRSDPVALEQETRRMSRFMHYLLVEKREREEILREHPDLSDVAKHVFSKGGTQLDDTHPYGVRSVRYFREVQDQDLPKTWAGLGIPVLALIGQYEVRTSAFDHELIANVVNHHRPGLAAWKELPRADHGLALHVSLADSVANEFRGPFASQALIEMLDWMNAVNAGSSTSPASNPR
jgi:pimeloyl-ACP methyl ester carboxylesterase